MSGRLLVAYSNSANHVSTTAEYLDSIARYSSWDVRYVHVTHDAQLDFDLNDFDAVFNNYCARLPFDGHVSEDYIRRLKSFRGVKILDVQDEYDLTNKLRDAIRNIGFHVVLTCVPGHTIERVYPRTMFARTEFINVLTGYVPEHLAERGLTFAPLAVRPIHIGYRGRDIGGRYGRLGFLKLDIGRRMREICEARGIPHDIEWAETKRLYGEGWYEFIASCRATLGSESGSNVFDFDGSIAQAYNRLSAQRGGPVSHEEFRAYTDAVEAQYDMAQISPRVFEAAAMHTPLILFSGRYSGLIEPEEHYIELKEDFSNVDAVLARLDDLDGLERMADRAYDRLVASGEFSYRGFAASIDETLRRKARELGLTLQPSRKELSFPEFVFSRDQLADTRERPTATPRHPMYFICQQLARQNVLLTKEVTRLSDFIASEKIGNLLVFTVRRLSHSRRLRAVGRALLALLPDTVGKRVKSGLVMILNRL